MIDSLYGIVNGIDKNVWNPEKDKQISANFSAKNIMNPKAWKPLPSGDGQKMAVRFQATGKQFKIDTKWHDIAFKYQGSLLSVLKDSELSDPIKEFRDFIKRIRSLELLSPQLMRKSARNAASRGYARAS